MKRRVSTSWKASLNVCMLAVGYIGRTFLVSNERKHFIFSLLLAVPACVCVCPIARECGSGGFECVSVWLPRHAATTRKHH